MAMNNPNNAPSFGMPDQEKEPMLLLDTTGSMNWATGQNDPTPRRETVREAIGIVVSALAKEDSQAAHEEEGGGLRTITFAGGEAFDIGDINPDNLQAKWSHIRWAGGTRIVPGLRKLLEVYKEEFGEKPAEERPLLLALVITDGQADDTDAFAREIARTGGVLYVALAILGYGDEHDRAVRAYQEIEQQNAHVKVIPFGSETDPQTIADAMLRLIS